MPKEVEKVVIKTLMRRNEVKKMSLNARGDHSGVNPAKYNFKGRFES